MVKQTNNGEENMKIVTSVEVKYANHDNDMLFTNLPLAEKLYNPTWTKEYINENWTRISENQYIGQKYDYLQTESTDQHIQHKMGDLYSELNRISSEDLLDLAGCEGVFVQQDPENGNIDHTSMSIGDLIIFTYNDKTQDVYYVDRCGFTKVCLLYTSPSPRD